MLIAVVALCGYINARLIRLPDLIGITAVALLVSLAASLLGTQVPAVAAWSRSAMQRLDFPQLIFHGVLGPLLFAGSLQLDFAALARAKWVVLVLATVGVVLSAAFISTGFFYGTALLGVRVPWIDCLLFGALISPTDPLAALGLLRKAGVPILLRAKITGEALFNDGTGVVLFTTLLAAAAQPSVSAERVSLLFAQQILGGVAFGLLVGYLGFTLLRRIDSYAVEILITLAMCTAGYAAAEALHVSAVIATVVMGLVIGSHGCKMAMSARTRERLFSFWQLTDEILNLLLFGMLGLELTALSGALRANLWLALLTLPLVLAGRWVSVAIPMAALRPFAEFGPHSVKLLTWAGLRGALSVALALSLPADHSSALIITITYVLALFSILVQATTIEPLARRLMRGEA